MIRHAAPPALPTVRLRSLASLAGAPLAGAALVGALLVGMTSPARALQGPVDWPARFAELSHGSPRDAFGLGLELAQTAPDEGFEVLAAQWNEVAAPTLRRQFLKAWYYSLPYPLHPRMHPRILDVLDLGLRDGDPEVRAWATTFLKAIAFREHAIADRDYELWYREHGGRPVADVLLDSIERFAAECKAADDAQLVALLKIVADNANTFRDLDFLGEAARDAGLIDTLLVAASGDDVDLSEAVLNTIVYLPLTREELEQRIVPLFGPEHDGRVRAAAFLAVGPDDGWAFDPLLEALIQCVTEEPAPRLALFSVSRALTRLGDPRAIPTMIGCIESWEDYDTIYGIGYFGLGRLLDVDYDESHDGAWWRQWWEQHKHELGPDVAALEIPRFERTAKSATETERDAPDVADVPTLDLRAREDEHKRYFLMGPLGEQAAPNGQRLLLVLPGGDGSADFHVFVKRIAKHAVGQGYVVAQLVARQWAPEQEVVWPTRGLPWPGAAFTTEEFVAAVIDDVETRFAVDRSSIFTLSWSSSGPAAYATSLTEGSRVTGSLVAMSVFKPDLLPPLERAAGHSYYVLHSPQDFIPIRMAEQAVRELGRHGAATTLVRYEGGHGWRGDTYDMISKGLRWLEQHPRR